MSKFLLPSGRVHKNYLKYLYWNSFSNFIVSIESVLSTHSMLTTVGANIGVNVSINFIGKDIIGQIGSLYAMNKIGKYIDKEPLRFLKMSLLLEQTSILMECATPIFPLSSFIAVGGISNVGKGIAFSGIGCLSATVVNKLSIDKDNIGEIYSKIGIVNTITTSVGMSLGLLIASLIPCHETRLCLIPILACFRYLGFYKSIEGIIDENEISK